MSEKIDTNKYTIQEAFKECFYVIPQYQREYVWTQKEISLLIDDILSSYNSSRESEYFIGTTIVSEIKDKNQNFDVIDGQQRLTTLFLTICALRSILDENDYDLSDLIYDSYSNPKTGKKETLIKLTLNYDGVENLIEYIAKNKLTPKELYEYIEKIPEKTNSIYKITEAYDFIYQQFKNLYQLSSGEINMEALGCLWAYISNKVVFIQIKTDVNSALKIFETINERGVGLNPMDLLKNLIFYQIDRESFKDINKLWHEITKPLEESQEKPLRFLRYYIMANFNIGNEYKDGVVREDQIFEWFKNNEKLCNYTNAPKEFVNNIKESVKHYINLTNGKYIDGTENANLYNFQKLCGGSFSLHYILLLSAIKLPKAMFNHLVKQLETLIFYFLITKNATKELEKTFTKWTAIIRDIVATYDKNLQIDKYNKFINDYLIKEIKAKEFEYESYFKNYDIYSLQQYRTKYILSKIAQYVDNFVIGENLDPKPLSTYLKLEIEHILPNTQKDYVAEDFYNNSSDDTRLYRKYDEYKVKLGNLTLLEKPINIVAGCNVISEKENQYLATDVYLTQSIIKLKDINSENSSIDRINKQLKSFDVWNDSAIKTRQELLYELSKKVWTITQYE